MRFAQLAIVLCLGWSTGAQAAAEPYPIHLGGDLRKISREECAQKALEVLLVQEKFPFAEIMPDGNVRGWNDKTSMLVVAFPVPTKEDHLVIVVSAGLDNEEAGRLRNVVRSHIFDAPTSKDLSKRPAPAGKEPPPAPVAMAWTSEERSAVNILRFFEPVVSFMLEKQGYGTNIGGNKLVFGGFPGRSVGVLLTPTSNALTVRLNVFTVTDKEETSKTLGKDLLSKIIKMLYE